MISSILSSKEVEKAASFFESARNIVIVTHMSPDGDAMGSSLGMKHYLQSISQRSGLSAQRSFSDSGLSAKRSISVLVPNAFPSFFAWMPGAEEDLVYESQSQEADALIEAADLIILTDFHEPKRIGSLGDKILATLNGTQNVLIVDHHLATTDVKVTFAKAKELVTFIESGSPSASELVFRLIYQLSLSAQRSFSDSGLSGEAGLATARCLYTGMMTDTGNFSFNSNYPEMYEIVGQLVAAGVNKDEIYNKVFNQYSADRMRLMGYCLYNKMRLFPEYHTALIYLSRKELYRFNFQSGDAEGLVNLPLQISDVYYSVFMREDKVNPSEINLANGSKIKVKISLRSQGDRPVNVLAHEVFGGGGHKNASGGEYYGPLSEAVQKFLDHYPSYFAKE